MYKGAILKNTKIDINGNGNMVIINRKSRLNNVHIKIQGNNHYIIVGEECLLNKSNLWTEDNNCKIYIGNRTTAEGVHFCAVEDNSIIKIGEDCMFAHGIELITTDSHSIINNYTKERINHAQNIELGNHIWIGAYAKILKGAIISSNSVVGVGSIVSKKFYKNNIVIAGIPAKEVRCGIDWLRERIK